MEKMIIIKSRLNYLAMGPMFIFPLVLMYLMGIEALLLYVAILPAFIFAIIFASKSCNFLTKDTLIIDKFLSERIIIPFNKITEVFAERTIYGGAKCLMLKLDPEFLEEKLPNLTVTEKWDINLGILSEEDQKKVIQAIGPIARHSIVKKEAKQTPIDNRLNILRKLNWLGTAVFVLYFSLYLIFFAGHIYIKNQQLYFMAGLLILFALFSLPREYAGYIKKVAYGNNPYHLAQAFQEQGIVRGKWAKFSHLIGIMGNIFLILSAIIIMLIAHFVNFK